MGAAMGPLRLDRVSHSVRLERKTIVTGWVPGLGRYVLKHPWSLSILLLAGWRLRRRQWWRTFPFAPLPDRSYWYFRLATAAGGGSSLTPQAMVDGAKWTMRQRVGH